jgi:AcrR family transcriptional regulator
MKKEGKRERMKALHRQIILESAKEVFLRRGFDAANMDEICEVSTYSRRTVYKYFDSKEEIYLNLVYLGLVELHQNIQKAIEGTPYFMAQYRAICAAMKTFYQDHPHSFHAVNQYKPENEDQSSLAEVISNIGSIGEEINLVLISFLEAGIKQKIILDTIHPRQSVYVMWSSISAILEMAENKEAHIQKQFGISVDDFLQYGFDQIIDSILEDRIHGAA